MASPSIRARSALPAGLPAMALFFGLACALSGCQAGGSRLRAPDPGPGPHALVGAGRSDGIDARVHAARRLVREHRKGEALRVLEEQRPLSEAEPERSWLLTAIWTERGEGARARREAGRLPHTAFGAALRCLCAETPDEGLRHVAPWTAGVSPWAHLAAGVAHALLGEDEAAEVACTRALRGAPAFVAFDAYYGRARALMEQGRLDEAETDAALAAQQNPEDARGPLILAEMRRRRGDLPGAIRALIEAMHKAPLSETYPRRIAELVRELGDDAPREELRAALARPVTTGPEPAERIALRALMTDAADLDDERAIGLYRQALAAGAIPVPIERELRGLLAARGRYAAMLELLLGTTPDYVRRDPHNLLHVEWHRLEAFVALVPDRTASADRRMELARTLVRVGALREAEEVLRALPAPRGETLRARVSAHRAFEQAMHEEIEAGYRVAHRKDDPPTFQSVLARVRALALAHLHPMDRPSFRDPTRGSHSIPIIGTWLDHSVRSSSPVVQHFRRFGKFLMVGQRSGLPTEAIVLSLASLRAKEPIRTPGGVVRHDAAVGYDRTLRGFINAQGGALGGACLADGMWLDADSTRHAENDMRRALELDTGLAERARSIPALAPSGQHGVFALTDTGGATVRLVERYLRRTQGWGSFGTLRAHEGSHALDIDRHLPILQGLPNSIALFVRNGLSPSRIEMELERRAQLGAVLLAPDPDLAVAEMMMGLPVHKRDPEVHDGGYRDGLALMIRHIHANPRRYPQIDRTKRIVTQLDRLSNDQLRAAARAALDQ